MIETVIGEREFASSLIISRSTVLIKTSQLFAS